jgi:hypothetical protein
MTEQTAPATQPPADEVLDVELELDADAGVDEPAELLGIPVLLDGLRLPAMFEPGDLLGTAPRELTPAGVRILTQVREELESWKLTHYGAPPAAIRLAARPPAPWTSAGHRRDVAEAAASIQNRPVPAGAKVTSRSAAELARRHAGDVRRRVLAAFVKAAGAGLTDDELSVEVGITPQRVATRRKELQDDGLLAARGDYRRTRTNSLAVVHKVTELGLEVWRALNTGPGVGPVRR